jgi:hypothetical protein
VLLKASLVKDDNSTAETQCVKVSLTPTNSSTEPVHESWEFVLSDYVNLESWSRAAKDAGRMGVLPALHYKSLSGLLSQFCHRFDLSPAELDSDNHLPYVDTSIPVVPLQTTRIASEPWRNGSSLPRNPDAMDDVNDEDNIARRQDGQYNPYTTPRLETAFPLNRPHRPLDFGSDLWPGGAPWPGGDVGNPGMLMGPNHPAFDPTGMNPTGLNPPGLGMRPRFDPYGPPGGPTEGPRRAPPGGHGNPNPDHLPPPSNYNAYL